MVMRSMRMPDGRLKVLVQGLGKARIDSVIEHPREHLGSRRPVVAGHGDESAEDWTVEGEALTRAVRTRVEELLPLKNLPPEVSCRSRPTSRALADWRISSRRICACGSKRRRKCSRSGTRSRGFAEGRLHFSSGNSIVASMQADFEAEAAVDPQDELSPVTIAKPSFANSCARSRTNSVRSIRVRKNSTNTG